MYYLKKALADIFISGVNDRGGIRYLSSRDITSINANIAQTLEFVERTGGDDKTNKFLADKFRSIGMNLKLLNVSNLSSKDQNALRPLLSQVGQYFDFSADPFTRGNFGFSVGNISINQGMMKALGMLVHRSFIGT